MAEMFYDDDADLAVIQGRKVAVIGYGSQGHAHALNLRDSGSTCASASPRARVPPQGGGRGPAGPQVADAVAEADLVVILTPDQVQRTVYAERHRAAPAARAPRCSSGTASTSASATSSRRPARTSSWSRPRAPATSCAASTSTAAACPCSLAVEQDASGAAWDLARSYAKAIGGLRAGGIRTTFTEETETDLFGEQAVLCGGASQLVMYGFETLVEAGLPARGRLLRVPARAQAHRRPHDRGRHRQAALVGLRHGGVRRLRLRARASSTRTSRRT